MHLPAILAAALAAAPAAPTPDAAEAFPPHRIADHLYYVGSKTLATYLVTTSKGHILINSGFDKTVPIIGHNVEQLGFKMGDVKILLESHAHSDHVQGMAQLQELTGAKVQVMKGDDDVISSGGAGQYFYKDHWKPCRVDRVLADGDKVQLGEATLVAHRTPGHTRGCTTWTMRARDAGKSYDVVIIGSPNVNAGFRLVDNKDYPEIAADFEKTFRVLKSLPCDIFLGAHGKYYGMDAKVTRLEKGGANPFVDPAGYRAYVEEREATFRKTLEEQRQKH
jgi:metallo-beta-lactamase class B